MQNILGIYAAKCIKVKRRNVLQYEGFAHLPRLDGLASLTTVLILACCVCLAYGEALMPTDAGFLSVICNNVD